MGRASCFLKTISERRDRGRVNRGLLTVAYVFYVELRTSEFPFHVGSVIDFLDRLFEHGDQSVDQNRDANEREHAVDDESQIGQELIEVRRISIVRRLVARSSQQFISTVLVDGRMKFELSRQEHAEKVRSPVCHSSRSHRTG